jgi:dTDP-4-dehydrorhamnose 3,5-epimerase
MKKNILDTIKVKILKIILLPAGNNINIIKKIEMKKWSLEEAYFSKIKFKKIKAWKFHKKMTLNLTVPYGNVKFVFHCPKTNKFRTIKINKKKYARITVPPKIWFGFKGLSKPESIILNLANFRYNKKEILRKKINQIKYNW